MSFKIIIAALLAAGFATCNRHIHEGEQHDDQHEIKLQYTVYSDNFELFAEADAFVVGEKANILSHFSKLPDFRPVEEGTITVILSVNGKEIRQTLNKPTRSGIYSFDIVPGTAGKGTLKFEIIKGNTKYEVKIPEAEVFANDEEAHEAAEKQSISKTNTASFTKEQSWKIDFSTDYPKVEPFGRVIKTTALVQTSQGNELLVPAKTNGIVLLSSNNILEGRDVAAGQKLFSVSANELADNNIAVKFAEAKSNFEKAKADYERSLELAKDKIVAEKDLIDTRNQYEQAKAVYDNLSKNFNTTGQIVNSPMSGFVKQVFVSNGAYVEAGAPILTVSQNKTLILKADVPQRYIPDLGSIVSANIRTLTGNQTYTFDQLNGKILSYGKAANSDNFLIPVNIQIDNKGSFTPGSFVELYLKTITGSQALTIPNDALLEEVGNYFVWVQINPELFEKREVTIGKTDGLRTEITRGIATDDRIVTLGAIFIKLAQSTGTLDAHSGHVH